MYKTVVLWPLCIAGILKVENGQIMICCKLAYFIPHFSLICNLENLGWC